VQSVPELIALTQQSFKALQETMPYTDQPSYSRFISRFADDTRISESSTAVGDTKVSAVRGMAIERVLAAPRSLAGKAVDIADVL
jgi:hypothetical protein